MTPLQVVTPGDNEVVSTLGLGRRFGADWALAHVDFKVKAGEVVLLAGANGSGKTTLLRLIAGLSLPTKGVVQVLGKDPWKDRFICRKSLSFIAHEGYLYPRLTALETVQLWSRLLEVDASEAEAVRRLDEVGLKGSAQQQVVGFSAGMQKRLSLLRARLESPSLLLLDEPFSALDQQGRRLVADWIVSFRKAGTAVVLASHVLDLAAGLADRGVWLDRGQLAWDGPAAELVQRMNA